MNETVGFIEFSIVKNSVSVITYYSSIARQFLIFIVLVIEDRSVTS